MIKPFLAATLLAFSTSFAFADDLSTKAMQEHPGTMGGSTSNATAKPNSGSLSEKQMQNEPGVNSDTHGMTATPNAKPSDGSIAGKEMQDNPGARK
ncbi:hypothetical protein [Hyphomicrobium sp.]|jgi:hypothetical protein|uniref:hypothetical protein n=1 Tax=Hyphomicrobium sp. TaxID=82 RepID=UPI002D00C7F0|nr:hypothetical protein [Hyphomicrobium sp.]HVZ05230.1 hypothetical protein [Hyphomicrobium sp.]